MCEMKNVNTDYKYNSIEPGHHVEYLWSPIRGILLKERPAPQRVFEIGCGNGAISRLIGDLGYDVVGIDPSISGIEFAQHASPGVSLFEGSTLENLEEKYGTFDIVTSFEVIEHCYDPRLFIRRFYELLAPGGLGIISTPYHGYLKNLAIAILGKFDDHFTVLWDGGHIKFFSIRTLRTLLGEAGFSGIRFYRLGRIPSLAKSMVAVFVKPPSLIHKR